MKFTEYIHAPKGINPCFDFTGHSLSSSTTLRTNDSLHFKLLYCKDLKTAKLSVCYHFLVWGSHSKVLLQVGLGDMMIYNVKW